MPTFLDNLPGVFDSLSPFGTDLLALDAGLFRIYELRAGSGAPPWEFRRILHSEPFTRTAYGPLPPVSDDDYYLCDRCGQHHLRSCAEFQGAPVVGEEHWLRYYVELSRRGGYARIHIPGKDLMMFEKGVLRLPELSWTNKQKWPWQVSGYFLMHKEKLFAYEVFSRIMQPIEKDVTIKLTPEIRAN